MASLIDLFLRRRAYHRTLYVGLDTGTGFKYVKQSGRPGGRNLGGDGEREVRGRRGG
jgi:hypothetical protein